MKRLNEFADDDLALDGEKVKIDDLVGEEIFISNFRIGRSKYEREGSGEYLTLQFSFEEVGTAKILFTGSAVIIRQIKKYADQIPFIATIVKVNRYYALK
jgi:hypothetical protein